MLGLIRRKGAKKKKLVARGKGGKKSTKGRGRPERKHSSDTLPICTPKRNYFCKNIFASGCEEGGKERQRQHHDSPALLRLMQINSRKLDQIHSPKKETGERLPLSEKGRGGAQIEYFWDFGANRGESRKKSQDRKKTSASRL